MNHRESVDHDAVLRARTLLLGSGTINIHEAVDAYRLLAEVSPAVYLPRLAQALLEYGTADARNPGTRLSVVTEAAAAVRRMEAADPRRAELLRKALEAREQELTASGRTDEARSVSEEPARTAGGEERTR